MLTEIAVKMLIFSLGIINETKKKIIEAFIVNSIMSDIHGFFTRRIAWKYPLRQEPTVARGSEIARILIAMTEAGFLRNCIPILGASMKISIANKELSVRLNFSENSTIFSTFPLPFPISSETKRLVHVKILPLARIITNA